MTVVEGRWHVVRRFGWWVVDDLRSQPRDTVTGGYRTKREAAEAARALAAGNNLDMVATQCRCRISRKVSNDGNATERQD